MDMNTEMVGIGEYKLIKEGILQSIGLGSCVGICLWDNTTKIGGLCRIMLASSGGNSDKANPYRYADRAIEAIIDEMQEKGADKESINAKIFGGANLFPNSPKKIGESNINAVRNELDKKKIPIIAEDVGGNEGRTIEFETGTGKVKVCKVFGEKKEY